MIFLCAWSKEAGTVGDETKKNKNKVEGVAAAKWVRTHVIYTSYINTYMCIYTGMNYLFFFVRGAREEAGTVGDEVKYVRIYIYTPKQAPSATTQSRRSRLRNGNVRTYYKYTTHTYI